MSPEMSFLSPTYLEAITDKNGKIFQTCEDKVEFKIFLKVLKTLYRV